MVVLVYLIRILFLSPYYLVLPLSGDCTDIVTESDHGPLGPETSLALEPAHVQ